LRELGAGSRGALVLVQLEGDKLADVRYAALEGPGCEQLPPQGDLEARGNEPFWSLRIEGDEAQLRTPETPDGVRFEQGRWTAEAGGGWRYEAKGPAPSGTITLEIAPERCTDSMSGAR
jgi:uncharacterized membrane protein